MSNTQAFTGIALADSDGGAVLVRINVDTAADEPEIALLDAEPDWSKPMSDPLSAWSETIPDDEKSAAQIVADAAADITNDPEDPASAESEEGSEPEEDVNEQFDEGA